MLEPPAIKLNAVLLRLKEHVAGVAVTSPLAIPRAGGHYLAVHPVPRTVRVPMRARLLLPSILAIAALQSPVEAQRLYRLELSAAGGYNLYDSKLELGSTFGAAGRLGYWVYGPLSVELEGAFAKPTTSTPLNQKVSVSSVGGWVLGNFPIGNRASFFVKGGYGHTSFGTCPAVSVPGSGPCGSAGVIQGGAGARINLTPTILMRYEFAVSRSLTTLKFSNAVLQGGLSLMLGSKPLVDNDGDGVFDRYDACPGTRLGALVDKRGCPTDRDGDGVPDGVDRCPNTPEGATVDAAGCTADSDGDGYLDGLDQCPDTPKGALVDARGCPGDSDGDGVFDGLDRCPLTPAGATVDALGCPGDSDNDGVLDGLDKCPDTKVGTPVDANGCATTPPPAPVDSASKQETWIVPGSTWALRGSTLSAEALPVLDSVIGVLTADPKATAEVNGFAQDRLVPTDNTRLSQRRADVVRKYLVGQGIDVSRITSVGRGSQTLIVSDTTEAARSTNRRVEIRVTHNP